MTPFLFNNTVIFINKLKSCTRWFDYTVLPQS